MDINNFTYSTKKLSLSHFECILTNEEGNSFGIIVQSSNQVPPKEFVYKNFIENRKSFFIDIKSEMVKEEKIEIVQEEQVKIDTLKQIDISNNNV